MAEPLQMTRDDFLDYWLAAARLAGKAAGREYRRTSSGAELVVDGAVHVQWTANICDCGGQGCLGWVMRPQVLTPSKSGARYPLPHGPQLA